MVFVTPFTSRKLVLGNVKATTTNPNARHVRHELARFQARQLLRLRFGAQLEEHFEATTRERRSRQLWFKGWLMTLAFVPILIGDHASLPGQFRLALLVRCALTFPILLGANELLRHNPRKFIREGSIVVTTGTVACSSFLLYHNAPDVVIAGTQVGLLIALLVTNVVERLRFPYAVVSTLLCISSDVLFLYANPRLTASERASFLQPFVVAALAILLSTYSIERDERRSWLLHVRNELQSEELTRLNRELARLSAQDGLTGLANRGGFDERLPLLWEQALANNTQLSAILIDIDHFKSVNDTYGHLYGDEVIRRVASLILQSLRGKADFAARYGGEEFVVLLPETSHQAAMLIGERIRSLIEIAGSPPSPEPTAPTPTWTTVSCGVATLLPAANKSPRDLLLAADSALYAAKSAGRNCVRSAEATGRRAADNILVA